MWSLNTVESAERFIEMLKVEEAVMVALMWMVCKNCELIIIYYVFYWMQRKQLDFEIRKKNDLELKMEPQFTNKIVNFVQTPRQSEKLQILQQDEKLSPYS